MSAASPAIVIAEARPAGVRGFLRRLYFRRRLFRALADGATALACTLAALCTIAIIDYLWLLPRVARAILLASILLLMACLLARVVWLLTRRRTFVEMAREIESASGSNENALVTFAEALFDSTSEQAYMLARLERQAHVLLSEIDEDRVAPRVGALRRASLLALSLAVIFALSLIAPAAFRRESRRVLWLESDAAFTDQATASHETGESAANAPVSIESLRVRVLPPAYTGLSVEEMAGDAPPVRVLAGSQVEVWLSTSGPVEGAALSFNGASNAMRANGAGRFSGAFTASASGAFEASVSATETAPPAPIVRAVEVYQDAPPEARLTEPVGDQLWHTRPRAPVTVRWMASDDLGLSSVALKYIKSRGEGDSARFTNGELSVGNIERSGARQWQGTTALDPARLDMQPGDTLVFWLEARDRNPNANNNGRSASLAIAFAAPELAKLTLSDLMPSEIGRFLLSERQIIIKTEKLHGERARLSAVEVARRANEIAADQRDFKNSFNDYIHLEGAGEAEETQASGAPQSIEEQVRAAEDERTATHFHGIPEPPAGSSTTVKEMTYAIRAMWDAEDALTNADTFAALKYEREALVHLKSAQSATRYVPPIVAQSKPLDLKRRYAGELVEIRTRLEKLKRRPAEAESAPVRAALADAYAALSDLQGALGLAAQARAGGVGRARERAREAATRLLAAAGGDHAATMAEAAGQLRIVEAELERLDASGSTDDFAARISKPLALLTQAASNLFAIAESRTRAPSGDARTVLPADEARAADYFRRLLGVEK